MSRTLTADEARRFYDRFGKKQDSQAFYEDAASDLLRRHADFESAARIFELGCGTGRFARKLFEGSLSERASYFGVDVSSTMIALARENLAPWGQRARAELIGGEVEPLPGEPGSFDRFVSNFVFDLLSEAHMRWSVLEAHRLLMPGGQIALTSLCA